MSPETQPEQIRSIEVPPLTGVYAEPFSLGKVLQLLRFFGPAAILASLSLGAGETIMATGLGAWSGYGLLWLLLLSVLVKGVFFTYLVGRYTAITGMPISQRLVQLPGPRGWLLLSVVIIEVSLISMGLTSVAKPCGNLIAFLHYDYVHWGLAFGIWENAWTTILMALAMSISLATGFESLKTQQIVICGLLVFGTVAATLIIGPDFRKLAIGALSFGAFPPAPIWAPSAAREDYILNLVTVFGYVGGSLSGYLAYSNWISISGWGLTSHPDVVALLARGETVGNGQYLPRDPEQQRRVRALLAPVRWDVAMGAIVLFIVTAAFLTSGAAVLYPQQTAIGGNEWQLLTKQASIWRQVHTGLVPIYYLAVILALWGTLASVPEAITRVTHDFISAIWPRFAKFPFFRLQVILAIWFFATSLIWTWSGVSFNLLTQIGSFLSLNVGLFVVYLSVMYFNWTLPKPYRPSRWMLLGSVASALLLFCCVCGSAVGLLRKLMN